MTRMEALEAVADAAREERRRCNDHFTATEWEEARRQADDALDALDALPPDPAPAGEVVEVRAVVLASSDGNWTVFGSDTCDDMDHAERRARLSFCTDDEVRVAILVGHVPRPSVPTIPGTVRLPLVTEGGV